MFLLISSAEFARLAAAMSRKELPKAYEPKQVEDAIYAAWEKSGAFRPENLPDLDDRKESFTISLPPPNVTGTLHMGHAVMLAIEDAMIRFARMSGKRALWVPGTDHAAIATESKVEKLMIEKDGKTRHDIGRGKFLKRVEKFAQGSHDTIVNQMKKMGTSVDWSREAYTFDKARNRAVNEAFKRMYDEGLIYRGHRVVNWDPKMQSNVSDDEIERIEEKTSFYYFQYGPFVIGTARPETKFGDKYVVMHPDDKRYAKYKDGDTFECEWINGKITATIVKDEHVDPEFGSGVMTITPWHDVNDFYIAERHNLDKEQVIDFDGKLLPIAGEFAGMPIEEARPKIVEKLKDKGLLVKIDEDYEHAIATNYRGGGVLEPQVREQWFVDVNKEFKFKQSKRAPIKGLKNGQKVTLKKLMQHAVRSKQIEIIPDRFNKTYFHWIDNLRDWCISRQIWFGHRVPVWYKGEKAEVGECPKGDGWEQDPDTLDTWFSSGTWTFSTLGWPDETDDLKTHHPTSVLETGYDILFFWVARMILMSTYLLGEVPFHQVYLHGLVRDENGKKMSKSLGNVIDPLEMINKYGADATRLSLMIGMSPGNDSKLSEDKIGSYRNFTNKLWNIARFVMMNVEDVESIQSVEPETIAEKWIIGRFSEVTKKVTKHFEKHEFSMAGELLRHFTWSEFADWYLEMAKVQNPKSKVQDRVLLYILERLLKLWHPLMPFVTEELYKEFGAGQLIVAEWPKAEHKIDKQAASAIKQLRAIVTFVRDVRARYDIPRKDELSVKILGMKTVRLDVLTPLIAQLSGACKIETDERPDVSTSAVIGEVTVYVDLKGKIDLKKEQSRLKKELDETKAYMTSLEKRLKGDFSKKAPKEVVASEKDNLAAAKEKVQKLEEELTSLS